MIYFIRNLTTGNFKIGYSEKPHKRLKELQTGSAERLVLIKTIDGDQGREKQLHEQFAHRRLDGEWFSACDEIIDFIRDEGSRALVGKFFHTYKEEGELRWQGYVVSEPREGYFLVQLYEWFMGQPSCMKLVRIDTMLDWDFYDTAEDMNFVYETQWARRHREQPGGSEGRLSLPKETEPDAT